MTWVLNNLGLIASLTGEHLRQSLIPILIGLVLSVPLGWLAWQYRLVRSPIVVITGLLYTVPSLALLSILPAIIGVRPNSEVNLIVALSIYAIALLVRSVVDGLNSVDNDIRLAAVAMGYGSGRRFWSVDLPLAGPVILAGLRVAAASTIALATVGALFGITNLGYLFTNGLQRRIIPEVLAGMVAVALVAIVVDLILVAAGRLVLPWAGNRPGRRRQVAAATVQVGAAT